MKKNTTIYGLLSVLIINASIGFAQQEVITTLAGNGVMGFSGDGSCATAAELKYPYSETVDKKGNVYVCDYSNYRIRKVNPAGIISTFGGNGLMGLPINGTVATAASFEPTAIAMDINGNFIIADNRSHCIYKIDTLNKIHILAGTGNFGFSGDGGAASIAELNRPNAVAVDHAGNIYLCDNGNSRIRMINTLGIINTIAGDGFTGYAGDGGAAISAKLNNPTGIALDLAGNLYITDCSNNCIRKVNLSGIISTVAGNDSSGFRGDGGFATAALLDMPMGIITDSIGNIYFSDMGNARIREISTAGIITTLAGKGISGYAGDFGPADSAAFNDPYGLAISSNGFIYVADEGNSRIRKMFPNYVPAFTRGENQSLVMCENNPPVSIDSQLTITDADSNQLETWSLFSAPEHGTVIAAYAVGSNKGIVVPSGLTYQPDAGFAGTDNFSVRIYDGYSSDTTTIAVIVEPNPALGEIAGNDSLCVGIKDTLTATATGGTWTISFPAIASVSAFGVVTGILPGVDTVIYSNSNRCGSAILKYKVVIEALPDFGTISGHDSVCIGTMDTLNDLVTGGIWSVSSSLIATVSGTGIVTGLNAGMDTIYYGNYSHACGMVSTNFSVQVSPLTLLCRPTGTGDLQSGGLDMNLSPNPAENVFNISWSSSLDEKASVLITDMTGRKVSEFTISSNHETTVNANLPTGIYLLTATSNSERYTGKIVIRN